MLSLPLAALEGPEDRAAFLRFYDAHAQGLLRYARSLLREQTLAEEAVQEAWLRCIRNAATFLALPEEERLPWMAVVVRNAAFTLRRRELRHQPIPDGWDAPAPDRHGAADIVAGDAGELSHRARTEVRPGVERPGHRPRPGSAAVHRHQPHPARPQAAPGRTLRGGI